MYPNPVSGLLNIEIWSTAHKHSLL
jgi:hypothetical protein